MKRVLLMLTSALCLTGCQSWFKDPGLPYDPLFELRKPVETKGKQQPPQDVPFLEITPPTDPFHLPAFIKLTVAER